MFTFTAHPGVSITTDLDVKLIMSYQGCQTYHAYLKIHRHYRS